MLDLLVIWGHSSDDSISNPQVGINRACKQAGLPQPSPNLATSFPQIAGLFISYYSFPPVNMLAYLIIILKEILSWLFSFSWLFKGNIPTQLENKTKPATGTWCSKYTWAAPAWHKDGSQVPRVLLSSTVLPENKCGEKPYFAKQAAKAAISRHTPTSPIIEGCTSLDSLNSPEHKQYMCSRVFVFHHKGFLTTHCGSLNHRCCLSCLQGALQMLPGCGNTLEGSAFWELCESLLTAPSSHSGGYQRPCFPTCSSNSHRPQKKGNFKKGKELGVNHLNM